jgi:xylulokinase
MARLLGIDVGTSSVKALLFDSEQKRVLAVQSEEYPIHTPSPDRAEQDPDDYWQATVRAVRHALHTSSTSTVAAIGFSGQMHGTIMLGSDLRPLHPAIIWADARTVDEPQQLLQAVPDYAEIAGTIPAAGFMACSLRWLSRHSPALVAQARQVILPKDYVRLIMTGSPSTDISDAAGTGMLDVARREWSDVIIAAVGIHRDQCPTILGSAEIAGRLRAQAAAELGLPAGIPIAAGCADQPAQAIGNGLVTAGIASVTVGTGGQVFCPLHPTGRLPTDRRLHVFNHAVPGQWYVLGAVLCAGLSLRWLRGITGLADYRNAYDLLSAEAAAIAPGSDGLIFLPYLTGERTPLMDPQARGMFLGLSLHHTRGHLARAVMEGVSFAMRQALELSLSLSGAAETVIASGGAMESDVWRSILMDSLGRPLRKSLMAEQAGLGAALLAGVSAHVYTDFDEACKSVVRYGDVGEPNAANHRHYQAAYDQFLSLYPLLKDQMHALAARTR